MQLIVPPTYLWPRKIDERVRSVVAQALDPAGHQVAAAAVPKKPLAVRSTLAAYGKNNISYVPGTGSYRRLVALYSDLPCEDDTWRPAQMLSRCETCSACVRRCPSGAITPERFLLRAERCITFHNEKDSSVAFPTWFQAGWQDCLVGCMRCQAVCPENSSFVNWVEEAPTFSQQETDLLLSGRQLEQLPSETAEKLRQSAMAGFLEVVPRNLLACLEQAARWRREQVAAGVGHPTKSKTDRVADSRILQMADVPGHCFRYTGGCDQRTGVPMSPHRSVATRWNSAEPFIIHTASPELRAAPLPEEDVRSNLDARQCGVSKQ